MTLFTLVRHGQTDWNLNGRVQGRTDIPLNDTGRAQARAAGEQLLATGHDTIVASPLSRARETAEIIADVLGLPAPALHDGLVERDYGSGEGLTAAELAALHRRAIGPDAEADDAVADRATDALRRAAAEHDAAGLTGSIVAVAHGALIRVLMASTGARLRPGQRLENGSQHLFRLDGDALELVSSPALALDA